MAREEDLLRARRHHLYLAEVVLAPVLYDLMREPHARLDLLIQLPPPLPARELLARLVLPQPLLLEGLPLRVRAHLAQPLLAHLRLMVQRLLPPPLIHLQVFFHPLHLLACKLLRTLLRKSQV